MKATKDFQYANQVFEVQLENAEWLETKQDGDTLYIEDNTYVANDAKDPIEFLPGGTSSSTGDGSTETTDVLTATTNYKNALASLLKAKQAYIDALTENKGTMDTYQAALADVTVKEAAYTGAKQAAEDAQKLADADMQKYEDAKANADATVDQTAIVDVVSKRAGSEYVGNMGILYESSGYAKGMAADIAITGANYEVKNLVASTQYFDEQYDYVTGAAVSAKADFATVTDPNNYEDFTANATANTANNGAFTTDASSKLKYVVFKTGTTLTTDDMVALNAAVANQGGGAVTDIKIVADSGSGLGNDTKVNNGALEIEVSNAAKLFEELSDKLELTQDGQNMEDAFAAAEALYTIENDTAFQQTVSNAIQAATAESGKLDEDALQKLLDAANLSQTAADKKAQEVKDAEAAYNAAKAKADALAPTDVATTEKAYADAQTARTNAGTTLFGARVNVGDDMDQANTFVKSLDPKAGSTDETLLKQTSVAGVTSVLKNDTVSDWEDVFNGTAVAANVDIEVGSETLHIKVTKKTNSTIIVETDGYKLQKDDEIRLPLFVRTTGGVASVGDVARE